MAQSKQAVARMANQFGNADSSWESAAPTGIFSRRRTAG